MRPTEAGHHKKRPALTLRELEGGDRVRCQPVVVDLF
eukprot:COSAG06_NODE_16_length_34949_cov_31.500832_11_plen_37_part_00